MKTFLFLCFCVVSFFVGFLMSDIPDIIRRFKNKKVTNSQQEKPLFKKGDIVTYEEYYNNPFGAKYWYLIMDVQMGGNGKWYYKYIKCNYAGIPEPRAQYDTGIMYPGVFVKVGFVALS